MASDTAPPPPDGARMLTVRIEQFADPLPRRAATLEGLWELRAAASRPSCSRRFSP